MNVGLVLEITANMIEQVILIGFLYLFFDKPEFACCLQRRYTLPSMR